jgi:2,4-dienoyl-CoA reductase-like NADH-dependent reductase (Old Yellow Enzyme family)/thioredoxin reductase
LFWNPALVNGCHAGAKRSIRVGFANAIFEVTLVFNQGSRVGKYKHIFTPVKIGRILVKNRIEFPPVGPLLANNGLVSRELIEWGRQFARGGAGIVTLGDSAVILPRGVSPAGSALNLGTDLAINPLNRFAETVQRYGAKASIQLNHHFYYSPTDMKPEEIKMLIESFAAAAHRCLSAGMDMVLIHGAHGQLISQFVSPRKNHRNDAYGGTLINRARLVVEILEAIRDRVGDKLAIEYRISAEELVPDGLTLEEQLEFARMIQDKIDLMHISAGMLEVPEILPRMIQPTYIPRGINVRFAERFKKELKIPVTTVGSLDLEMAEQIIAENKADVVAMARNLIADPDCINKSKAGDEDNIRPCVRCNTCIDRTHTKRLPVHCTVNPHIGREAEFAHLFAPLKKKKVVVVGGGPAGMETARESAKRGHEVVLLEKEAQLGGTLAIASAAPFKTDMKRYLNWAIRATLNTPNLTIKLSTDATPDVIKAENPDALIIACGSTPVIPQIPGANRENVVWAGDIAQGKAAAGKRVVVAGAGLTGSETALFLAQQGKRVVLIDISPIEKIDAGIPLVNIVALRRMLVEAGVGTKTEVNLEAITGSGVTVIDKNWERTEIPCDTVVLSLGVKPRTDIDDLIKDLEIEIYTVGDCNNQGGNLYSAVSQGFFAAMEI